MGAVLSQHFGEKEKLFLVVFFSGKFAPAKRNYNITYMELLVVKLALEEWRHSLEVALHPFMVFIDHKNLEYSKDI